MRNPPHDNPDRPKPPVLAVLGVFLLVTVIGWGVMAATGLFRTLGPKLTIVLVTSELATLGLLGLFAAKRSSARRK